MIARLCSAFCAASGRLHIFKVDFVGTNICQYLIDWSHHLLIFIDKATVNAKFDSAKQKGDASHN